MCSPRSRLAAFTGVIVAFSLSTACGGGSKTNIIEVPDVDTTTLVGTWEGTVDGDGAANSFGYSTSRSSAPTPH